jgi:hypothetical protein
MVGGWCLLALACGVRLDEVLDERLVAGDVEVRS